MKFKSLSGLLISSSMFFIASYETQAAPHILVETFVCSVSESSTPRLCGKDLVNKNGGTIRAVKKVTLKSVSGVTNTCKPAKLPDQPFYYRLSKNQTYAVQLDMTGGGCEATIEVERSYPIKSTTKATCNLTKANRVTNSGNSYNCKYFSKDPIPGINRTPPRSTINNDFTESPAGCLGSNKGLTVASKGANTKPTDVIVYGDPSLIDKGGCNVTINSFTYHGQ